MNDDAQEAFEERAAIMEYCAGLPRPEAEYRARRCFDKVPPKPKPAKTDHRTQAAREALSQAKQILNGE